MEKMLNMFIMTYIHQCGLQNVKEQSSCNITKFLKRWYDRAL